MKNKCTIVMYLDKSEYLCFLFTSVKSEKCVPGFMRFFYEKSNIDKFKNYSIIKICELKEKKSYDS